MRIGGEVAVGLAGYAGFPRAAGRTGEAMRLLRIPLLVILAIWLAVPGPAVGQAPQGLESLTPEERARVQENLERWKQLSPDERQRVREKYERSKQLSPEERQRARQNLETFRRLPPEARRRIRENQQRWQQLPPEERARLRERLERWKQLSHK